MNLVTRAMPAAEVRVGDRLVTEDRRPLVIVARTLRGHTTIQCAGSATINVPARTPITVQRRSRVEDLDTQEVIMPRFATPEKRKV